MPKMEYLPMFTIWSKQRCLFSENGDVITIKLNICQKQNICQEWDICDMPKMEYSLGMVAFVICQEWDFCDMPTGNIYQELDICDMLTENICQKWNICREWDFCDMSRVGLL